MLNIVIGGVPMKKHDVYDALKILKQYYITDSKQMVARWLREGRIKGFRTDNRKEGWTIFEEDLYDFIDRERPGLRSLFAELKETRNEYQELRSEVGRMREEVDQLKANTNKPIPKSKSREILTTDEFKQLLHAILSKDDFDIKLEENERVKQQCEALFFNDGMFAEDLYDVEREEFICPHTKERAKYFKPLLKRLLRILIDSKDQVLA
jgi:hypothetical protein